MSHIGKKVRLSQIINNKSGKQVCIAMDHCPAIGPVKGMIDVSEAMKKVCAGNPDTIFTHYGVIKKTLPILLKAEMPFLLSISTATSMSSDPTNVYLVDSVLHAVQIGASGVSMRIFVGAKHEVEMLKGLAFIISECEQYGMPVMAMKQSRPPPVRHCEKRSDEAISLYYISTDWHNLKNGSRDCFACARNDTRTSVIALVGCQRQAIRF